MKILTANGALHSVVATRSGKKRSPNERQRASVNPASGRSEQAVVILADLKHALETSQRELRAARREIATLAKRDSRFRQRFLRLAAQAARVRHAANHDVLTGLPNRSLLFDRFNQAVAQASRQQKQVILLFLDLDGFKSVNDKLGHSAGDRVLQQVARRLAGCVRVSDTVCRYGGDEFVIMLPEVDGRESATAVMQKIRGELATPYVVDGSTITVTASIGTAVYPVDGQNYGALIQRSDIDMYRIKTLGSEPHHVQTRVG